MFKKTRGVAALVTVALALSAPAGALGSWTAAPKPFTNCKTLNAKYPHGVGRANARDRTKSGDPVTTFKRSTRIYNRAISLNSRLDADKDGVACEKD